MIDINSSSYYKAKIEYYAEISSSISSLSSYCTSCTDSIDKCNNILKYIVISKKSIDDGKLASIQNKVNSIPGKLSLIINECQEKIKQYQILYAKAKNLENMRFMQQKKKNDGGIYESIK